MHKRSRVNSDKNWNASTKGQSAKQKWKDKNPKWAWVVSAVGGARTRAKWANIEFDITNEYIYGITADTCPALGIQFVFGGVGFNTAVNPSIDRIDPKQGYIKGNMAVISHRANMIKSNASSDELRKIAEWLHTKE